MGVVSYVLALEKVGREFNNRLDQERYLAEDIFQTFVEQFEDTVPLGSFIEEVRNGVDIAQAYYSHGVDTGVLYLSVNQIASARGSRLELRDATFLELDPADIGIVVEPGNVVITRSGTPGVAWAATGEALAQFDAVIPSGYTQLLRLREGIRADFLAAYLNLPPLRMLTRAYACGKDQLNLSQDYLLSIPVPRVEDEVIEAFVLLTRRAEEMIDRAHDFVRGVAAFQQQTGVAVLIGGEAPEELDLDPRALQPPEVPGCLEHDWSLPKRRQSD